MNTIYVIGAADSDMPWVLNLDGYATEQRAQDAINWQRVGQGQFDPPNYWRIVTLRDGQLIGLDGERSYVPDRRPYTIEAWQAFTTKTGLQSPLASGGESV